MCVQYSITRGVRLIQKVDIRRSARRRRTVSAYRDGDSIVVLLPARFSAAQEREWTDKMVASVLERERRAAQRGARRGDAALLERARGLSARWLDGRAEPLWVAWVDTMSTRWASCTPADRTIRVSRRLSEAPDWVLDYVLVHELAHLIVPGHGPAFWELADRYPRTQRARGYLDGLVAGARLGRGWGVDGDVDADVAVDVDVEAQGDTA